jgi:cytochrome-b5 reductase
MEAPLEKPEPPADNECCDSGCEPCVWDVYREQLVLWQAQQKQDAEKN